MTGNESKDVDAYIDAAPDDAREKLRQVRRIIRESAPQAQEKLSYGMPYYGYKGRLAYFAYAKKHIGLYIPPPVVNEFKQELKGFKTAKATVQFPLDKKLPVGLIRKLVKARIRINDAKTHK